MSRIKKFTERHPVVVYVLLCYGISWPVWFAIPLVAGTDWTLVKILIGIGFGPALAAIILEHVLGKRTKFVVHRWWTCFSVIFLIVTAINISSLITGDAPRPQGIVSIDPPGLTSIGIVGSLLAAAVCGFIFASIACSGSARFSSILAWRQPLRWWLVALFLFAAVYMLSLVITMVIGGNLPESVWSGVPVTTWVLWLLRSTLFTLLVVAVGEEPGWRGWMLPKLQKRFNFFICSILIGIVWGFWHFPAFINGLYPDGPAGILEYLIYCPALAVIYTWIYNHTGQNLLLVIVFHTAGNITPRIIPSTPYIAPIMAVLVFVICLHQSHVEKASGPFRKQIG